MEILRGRGLSRGFAVGPAVTLRREVGEVYRLSLDADQIEAEIDRLRQAVTTMDGELAKTRETVSQEVGAELSAIFDAHHLILHDPLFLGRTVKVIREQLVNAEWAVQLVGAELGEQFARIETAHLRQRGQDVEDVVRFLLAVLQGGTRQDLRERGRGAIIVADELTPSEVLRLGRLGVAGFVLEGGGDGSHTVIVARALSLPLVIGVSAARDRVPDGANLVIDGYQGTVGVQPDASELRSAKARADAESTDLTAHVDASTPAGPTSTKCGQPVTVASNIEILDEVNVSLAAKAAGIGLYRSEFLYIEQAPDLPTEEDHFRAYERLVCSHAPAPVTIRTFDLGGRELGRGLVGRAEANPGLGLRGVRLTLTQRRLFSTQLRALLRAATNGNLRILVPMVSSVDEVLLFRALLDSVRRELEAQGVAVPQVPVGVMIEVPAAALIADHLARVVDFMAIGTNDLTQYTLAVDRNNDQVAGLYRPLHPAVLLLVERVVQCAHRAGIELSLCGEIASEPKITPLLLGVGLRSFSMSPRAIADVRREIGRCDIAECEELWQQARACSTAQQVDDLISRS